MKKLIYIILVLVLGYGCQKWVFKKDKASNSPKENFEYLWHDLDTKYSYFTLKNINWDSVHTAFESKISESMSEEALFDTLKQLIFILKDDHSNLVSAFDVAKYNIFAHHNKNFNWHLIEQLHPEMHYTGPFRHFLVKNKNIAYVRYGSFMSNFSDNQLNYILTKYANTKGMILDLRENGGGIVLNVPKLLSRFIDAKTLIGYSRTKIGPEHNDFGPIESFYVAPSNQTNYQHPLVVLTDRGSYSATTTFAAATKAFDNITLIGDTTGGGGGLPGGGQLPNGWTYRFSISQFLYPDMNPNAELGVPPDVTASFNWNDMSSDALIDKAVAYIEAL